MCQNGSRVHGTPFPPLFMQTDQRYVWNRLMRAFGDQGVQRATMFYLEQTGLKSLVTVPTVYIDCRWKEEDISAQLSRFPHREELVVRNTGSLTPEMAKQLAQEHATVKHVTVHHSRYNNIFLWMLTHYCPHLESLTIFSWNGNGDEIFSAIAQNCPKLHTVRFCDAETNVDECIKDLTSLHSDIQSITISSAPYDADSPLQRMPFDSLSDVGMSAISKNCPSLTEVYLHGDSVTDDGIIDLARQSPMLKKIHSKSLNLERLNVIALHCRELEEVNLAPDDSDKDLKKFIKTCPFLVGIDATGNLWVDRILSVLARECPQLKKIIVDYCNDDYGDPSDEHMVALAKGCTELVSVSCRGNSWVSDKTLFALAESCPHLENIDFSDCPHITNAGVKKVRALRPWCVVYTPSESNCIIS